MTSRWERLTQWFGNRRIRTKIMLIYLPLLLAPLFVVGYTANTIYSNAIVNKSTQSFTQNSALIISRIDGMLENVESAGNMLALNLNRILQEGRPYGQSELARYNAITTQLSLALLVFPDADSIVFVDRSNRVYGTNPVLEQRSTDIEERAVFQQVMETNGINYWVPMERREYLTSDPGTVLLTMGKKIIDIQSGDSLGVLFIQVREDQLSAVLHNMNAEPSGRYFIADEQGTVISTPDNTLLLKSVPKESIRSWMNGQSQATDIRPIDGQRSLLAMSSFPQLGWKLVSITPLHALTDGLDKLQWTLLAVAALCSLFAILGAGFLSKRIARPIVELARSMKGFQEGHLDVQVEVKTRDELGYFVLGFNQMRRRIKELLSNVLLEQRKKREYELALIQAQIKPHFLYNTLDVIYALSQMNRMKEVQHTTKALADFYRAALSQGREVITLEEEFRNVRDYLAIQHIRYRDVFTYEFEISPDIHHIPILKLTIQPLVENAIYHGLKEKEGGGHLQIKGYLQDEVILIEVTDDGIGMHHEQQANLLKHTSASSREPIAGKSGSSYGLRNVNDRIKLFFGHDYGLSIRSKSGKGTTVTIALPKEWTTLSERDENID
ncbi:sensor histidine kinase [Paenibacillus lemnae]|uniref:histidine kinase n=1 Tax=Paenibacillus lemnae TaxID=1330551 RepID=A0A848M477_PAELE|nr:sensor histidine kinase [Paenibacillus lemnae]NMO94902.1 sensor histidine kinase [Paenibacillus lemnae]